MKISNDNDMQETRLLVVVAIVSMSAPAQAYVGPGVGLGVIGALLGGLAAILLALIGVVWYPIKRLLRGRKSADVQATKEHEKTPDATDEHSSRDEPRSRSA